MLRRLLIVLVPLALVTGCSADEADETEPTVPDYLAETFGLYLAGYDEADETFEEDGVLINQGTGYTWLEGDENSREMHVRQELFSAAEGGDLVLVVTDVASDESRYFLYNLAENFIVFGEDTGAADSRGAGVQANPDGTYEVWTFDDAVSDRTDVETVPDGYTAMRRVDAFNGFSEISPHVILTGFALAHGPTPEARFVRPPDTKNVRPPPTTEAGTTPVCSTFKAFCDCVACRVLDRGGDCDLCPAL